MINNFGSNFNLASLFNQTFQNNGQQQASTTSFRPNMGRPQQNNNTQMMQFLFMGMMQQMMGMLSQMSNQWCGCPPTLPPEGPPQYPPPVEPPPPPQTNKTLGSAGLFGDPQFGVFTPGLGNVPNALKAFESNIGNNQVVTLLNDADKGGLKVDVKGIQVDPNDPNTTGIGEATFKAGTDTVVFKNNGDLTVNGQVRGNIKSSGFIAPITLANGTTISTANEIDGAGGVKAERFVINNGEYKITAGLRSPHPDSNNFYDMNFEELTVNAADNATGYRTSVPGFTSQFGIVDLLKLEPGSFSSIA